MLDTQRCYICGSFFQDKVKLGLHLTPCYNDAVNIRKEMWHPHPLDLVDEQRYTEYMRGKYDQREKDIRSAQTKGVSFVSADNFDAIRGGLGTAPRMNGIGSPNSIRAPQQQQQQQQRPGSRQASSPSVPLPPANHARQRDVNVLPAPTEVDRDYSHRQQVAAPVRQVATGVTMLRNELSEELQKIKELRHREESNVNERQRVFEQMCNDVGPTRGSAPRVTSSYSSPPQQQYRPPSSGGYLPPVSSPPQHNNNHETVVVKRGGGGGSPLTYETTTSSSSGYSPARGDVVIRPQEMPDGRVKCPYCSKLFGKKGYEVHVRRCNRSSEDFTFSKDADFVERNPENRVKPDHDDGSYGRHFERNPHHSEAEHQAAFTQFMVTYPRPILDDQPKTVAERSAAMARVEQARQYKQMVEQEMSRPVSSAYGAGGVEPGREPTVPCRRCGRFFYESRVAKHEATCVSKPR